MGGGGGGTSLRGGGGGGGRRVLVGDMQANLYMRNFSRPLEDSEGHHDAGPTRRHRTTGPIIADLDPIDLLDGKDGTLGGSGAGVGGVRASDAGGGVGSGLHSSIERLLHMVWGASLNSGYSRIGRGHRHRRGVGRTCLCQLRRRRVARLTNPCRRFRRLGRQRLGRRISLDRLQHRRRMCRRLLFDRRGRHRRRLGHAKRVRHVLSGKRLTVRFCVALRGFACKFC